MKVRSFQCVERSLALVDGYRIAGHSINAATNFIVRVETDSGIVGHGCAAPAEEVTGETDTLCHEVLDGVLRRHVGNATLGEDPSDLVLKLLALAPGAPAACAAVDIALWDIASQAAGMPLAEVLGSRRPPMQTSVTIGICDVQQTLIEADAWIEKGKSRPARTSPTTSSACDDCARIAAKMSSCGSTPIGAIRWRRHDRSCSKHRFSTLSFSNSRWRPMTWQVLRR